MANSLLYMPEDEYNQWNAVRFKKEAEALAFPSLARRQKTLYDQGVAQPPLPDEPPGNPPPAAPSPLGYTAAGDIPSEAPISATLPQPTLPAPPMPSAPSSEPLPGFLGSMTPPPEVPVQGPRFGTSALGVPPDRGDIGSAAQDFSKWNLEQNARINQAVMGFGKEPGATVEAGLSFPGAGAIGGLGVAGIKPAARLASRLLPSGETVARVGPRAGSELTKVRDALGSETLSIGDRLIEAKDALVRAFYDRNAPLKALEEETGVPTHKLAQVVSGAAAAGEDDVRTIVLPIIQTVKNDVGNLETYLALRRMEDILAKNPHAKLPGGVNGWQGQIDALHELGQELGPARLQAVEDAAKNIWKANDDLVLKPKLNAGLLSQAQYDAIKSGNPHYIDFHRADYAVSLPTGGAKQAASLSNIGIDEMALTGSDLDLDQPLTRWISQVVHTPEEIGRNTAGRYLFEALKTKGQNLGADIARLVSPSEKAVATTDQGFISFFENGQQYRAIVPKIYADVAKGLEAETAGFLGKVAMAAAAPLRLGATTYNPAFLVINPVRDFITAAFKEGWGTVLSTDYIKGWVAAFTKNSNFSDAAHAGALMSGIIESYKKTASLSDAARMGGISAKTPMDVLLYPMRLIEAVNVASERATRIGTFLHLKGQGVSDLEAAVRARDVTVDFAKSGNVTRVINQAIPFLNAGIQGSANTLKVIRDHPEQAILRAAPLVAAHSLAFLWNQRFETAKLIPDYEYANNFVLQYGEGTKAPDPKNPNAAPEKFPIYAKLPLGPAGALLTFPAQLAMRLAWNSGDRSMAQIAMESVKGVTQSSSPIELNLAGGLPPILQTGVGVATNVDIFRNAPIVPQREQQRPSELQFGAETSKAAVGLAATDLAKKWNLSPRTVEFAIRDYTAGTGQAGLWLIDTALGALGYNPQIPGEAKQQQLTPTEKLAKVPTISRFIGTRNTQQERAEWDNFGGAVEDSRRQFTKLPDVVRLGINLGQVPDSFKENGKDRVLTIPERAQYQNASTAVMTEALPQVMARSNYKQADDAGKAKIIQEVMGVSRDYTRDQITANNAASPQEAGKEVAQAVGDMSTYRAIPRFLLKMPAEEERAVSDALDRIQARGRMLPPMMPNRQAVGLMQELQRAKTDQDRAAVTKAMVILKNPELYNPQRKLFWSQHPLLQKYYSDVQLSD